MFDPRLLEILTNGALPVMPTSNFWRATQRMKVEEEKDTLKPHLIIPELKNHQHLGGIIPTREFSAFVMFCEENDISFKTVFMSGRQVEQTLKNRKGLFSGNDNKKAVCITFEEKGDNKFALLVAVSPYIFMTFQHFLQEGSLDKYFKEIRTTAFHYPAETNLLMKCQLSLGVNFNDHSLFMRVKPNQDKDRQGERRRVTLNSSSANLIKTTLEALRSQGKPITIAHQPFKIATIDTGRPSFSDDPSTHTLGTCDVDLQVRLAGKRPNDSMAIGFNSATHIARLLSQQAPSIRLRVNDTALTLTA